MTVSIKSAIGYLEVGKSRETPHELCEALRDLESIEHVGRVALLLARPLFHFHVPAR